MKNRLLFSLMRSSGSNGTETLYTNRPGRSARNFNWTFLLRSSSVRLSRAEVTSLSFSLRLTGTTPRYFELFTVTSTTTTLSIATVSSHFTSEMARSL